MFSPIPADTYPTWRRLLANTLCRPLGFMTRFVWNISGAYKDSLHYGRLFYWLWRMHRALILTPRTESSLLKTSLGLDSLFVLDLSRLTDALAHCFGLGESDVRYAFDLLCRDIEKPTVLDVGANIGTTAIYFALKRPRGTVHAFEPNPAMFDCLDENRQLSNCNNIILHDFALSNRSGTTHLIEAMEGNPGSSYLSEERADGSVEVVLNELDQILPEIQVDFIKIDVEGSERAVLEGAIKTIERCCPMIIYECNPDALADRKTQSPYKLLEDLGYDFWLIEDGILRPMAEVGIPKHIIYNVIATYPSSE